jgi:hypothetical protein
MEDHEWIHMDRVGRNDATPKWIKNVTPQVSNSCYVGKFILISNAQ